MRYYPAADSPLTPCWLHTPTPPSLPLLVSSPLPSAWRLSGSEGNGKREKLSMGWVHNSTIKTREEGENKKTKIWNGRRRGKKNWEMHTGCQVWFSSRAKQRFESTKGASSRGQQPWATQIRAEQQSKIAPSISRLGFLSPLQTAPLCSQCVFVIESPPLCAARYTTLTHARFHAFQAWMEAVHCTTVLVVQLLVLWVCFYSDNFYSWSSYLQGSMSTITFDTQAYFAM